MTVHTLKTMPIDDLVARLATASQQLGYPVIARDGRAFAVAPAGVAPMLPLDLQAIAQAIKEAAPHG